MSRVFDHHSSTSKRVVISLLALALAGLLVVANARLASGRMEGPAVDEDRSGAPYVSGELIVAYEEDLADAPVGSLTSTTEGVVEESLPAVDSQLLEFPEVKREDDPEERETLLAEKKQDLEQSPAVVSADYNYIREPAAAPNDPRFGKQWHLSTIHAPAAWDVEEGDGASIAVIDTGADLDHPDLAGKIDLATNAADEGASANDTDGHGTHVAGIAAAATDNATGVAGTCPECRLMVAKVENGRGSITDAAIIKAIGWAADNDASVINMSLGGPADSAALREAVEQAVDAGVTVVAAAGNDDSSVKNYPAAYPDVLAVAATTRRDTRASYSNHGDWIDVAAPGGGETDGILSTVPGGYGEMSGTSMSAPIVAGVAGLLAGQGLSNTEASERILSTATDLGSAGRDDSFGEGRVDAAAAVGESSASAGNTAPTVTALRPKPGSKQRTRRVEISATVHDEQTDLDESDITLLLDGEKTSFDYDAESDRLTKEIKLPPGKHSVRVIATDEEGLRESSPWRFAIGR